MERTVTTIPATLTKFTSKPLEIKDKRRVAAYARVSTDKDEQFTSFEAQKDYYTRYIQEHDNWTLVDVYADEGISGTHMANRDGFKRMKTDALNGKIDLIITKSISRFARNTVDTLVTVRELKNKGIECYFEKENIWTLDSKSEILLTIMSSLAQEESRSISENVRWGWRKRFEDGKVSLAYSYFLGYDKGENGTLKINPQQAPIVRKIYDMFLEGMTTKGIATQLSREGVPKADGKTNWSCMNIKSILTNEKYTGNAILQKTFKTDLLSERRKNNGEVKKYYVQNAHEAIVTQEEYDIVQNELASRAEDRTTRTSCKYVFSNKVFCGDCGAVYGSKVWHSTDKYRTIVWQCNSKFSNEKKCSTPHLKQSELEKIYLMALNKLYFNKEAYLEDLKYLKNVVLNTDSLEKQLNEAKNEQSDASILIQQYMTSGPITETDLNSGRYDELCKRLTDAENREEELTIKLEELRKKRAEVSQFIKKVEDLKEHYTSFSNELFSGLCRKMTIYSKDRVVVTFSSGLEIELNDPS